MVVFVFIGNDISDDFLCTVFSEIGNANFFELITGFIQDNLYWCSSILMDHLQTVFFITQ